MSENEDIRVLLVDDEERFLYATAKALKRRRFRVKTATRAADALRELWKEEFDVIVLDVKMPEMDGHRALREIKARNPNIEVLMLTGHGSLDSALEGWRDQVFTYLTKPCDIDALAEMIRCAHAKRTQDVENEPSHL